MPKAENERKTKATGNSKKDKKLYKIGKCNHRTDLPNHKNATF